MRWADLLGRVFEIDVRNERALRWSTALRPAIDDPDVARRILGHLGLPTSIKPPLPARPPPGSVQLRLDSIAVPQDRPEAPVAERRKLRDRPLASGRTRRSTPASVALRVARGIRT